jgi:hypothetical protein
VPPGNRTRAARRLAFKFITLVIIAGVIVALASPARAASPAGFTTAPAAGTPIVTAICR